MSAIHFERDERGFTLVELLITLVLLPIVMGGLVMMLVAVFQTQAGVSSTLTGSDDSSVASTYVSQDVQSSIAVTTESTIACGTVGIKQLLGTKDSLTSDISSYVLVQNGTKYELVRETCTNSNTTTPISQTVVSANVPSTLTASAYCGSNLTTTCGTSSWEYSASVSKVYLSIKETTISTKTYTFSYAISAVPSLWNAASVGETSQEDPFPVPPLDILGSANGTCSSPNMSFSGNASINIAGGAGDAFDNSTSNDCIALSGNADIDASALETGDSTPATSYTKSGNAVAPLPPTYETPTGDPFAGLTPPTTPTATGSGSCGSSSCTPGNYSNAVNLSGNSSYTFAPGTYVFTQPVSIAANTTVVFGSGTFLFEGGLSLSGNAAVTFDSGTYIFEGTSSSSNAIAVSGNATLTDGTGGSLFYVKSGVIAFSGNGDISLSGESAYDGIAIWQASSDSNVATLSGNSGVDAAYGGVYVPDGEVVPSGNSIMSASFVIAQSVNYSGNSGLTVGG